MLSRFELALNPLFDIISFDPKETGQKNDQEKE
jgi:hypothetical protein